MAINPLPTPPSRGMSQDAFVAAADAFMAALPVFAEEANSAAEAMNLNSINDTSGSSNSIGTGAKTFEVSSGKSFVPGMYLCIADSAAPSTNSMFAQVTSYSGSTLIVDVLYVRGSGTKTSWVISLSAYQNNSITGLDFSVATEETAPDALADFLAIHDVSTSSVKKILLSRMTAFKVITFTRNLTTASGAQAVTGVGFKPKAVIFIGAINGSFPGGSWGFDDGTTKASIFTGATTFGYGTTASITIISGSTNYQEAYVSSFDTDGFTLTWTKFNAPTGTGSVLAICLR